MTTRRLLEEVDEYFEVGARIQRADCVLDVGANVGAFALRAAQRAGGEIKLFCFEPSPISFQALTANCAQVSLLSSVRPRLIRAALGAPEQSGHESAFYHLRNFPTDSTLDIQAKREEFEQFFQAQGMRLARRVENLLPSRAGCALGKQVGSFVANLPKGKVGRWGTDQITGLRAMRCPVETLEAVVRQESVEQIDLLKIDVEGTEVDVLRGGASILERVGSVVVETSVRRNRSTQLMEMLRSRGFGRIRTLQPRRQAVVGLDNLLIYATR